MLSAEKMAELFRGIGAECYREAATIKDGNWFRGFFQGRGDAYVQAAYFIETFLREGKPL